MSGNLHERAFELVAKARVEGGLADAEREWLSTHCEDCACSLQKAQSSRVAQHPLRGLRLLQ